MICASFSPGGLFMATGSADHHVRVYMMDGKEGPVKVIYSFLSPKVHAKGSRSSMHGHRNYPYGHMMARRGGLRQSFLSKV